MSYLYPYGDTQQLNLSWFLAKFKELYEYITNLDPDDIAITTVLSRFTNEYNSSTNYIPGDYVIHEGYIYKANQSTTGNFNPEAWDAALPVNDIQGLRILLGGISRNLTDLEENAVTNMQYTSGAADADGLLRQTKNGTAETVMTVDKEPTENSQNPVKSGAVQTGIAAVSQAVGSERTDRQNADTSLQNQIDDLNDITGDGSLTGFTATDLTGAANELKGSLNTVETNVSKIAPIITGTTNNSGHTINRGNYFIANGALYIATAAIPINGTWNTSATAISTDIITDATTPQNVPLSYVENNYTSSTVYTICVKIGRICIVTITLSITTEVPASSGDIVVLSGCPTTNNSKVDYLIGVNSSGIQAINANVKANGNITIGTTASRTAPPAVYRGLIVYETNY